MANTNVFIINKNLKNAWILSGISNPLTHINDWIMVMMDQINETTRVQRLHTMYAHIFGRADYYNEMRKIVEPPMHIDNKFSANIQFADWICALTKRAIDYQLLKDSRYGWIPQVPELKAAREKDTFTYESKLHLYERSIDDINNSCIMHIDRPAVDTTIYQGSNAEILEKVRQAALKDEQSRSIFKVLERTLFKSINK